MYERIYQFGSLNQDFDKVRSKKKSNKVSNDARLYA